MDSRIWDLLYSMILQLDESLPRFGRQCLYSDGLIVAVYLWAVGHDRPVSWACQPENYSSFFRPPALPCAGQMSRRLRTWRVNLIMTRLHEQLSRSGEQTPLQFIDGRPLLVGSGTKDADAKKGRFSGGFGHGYKLHAWAMADGRIPVWSVQPLSVNEKPVAMEMARQVGPRGIVLADAEYDSGPLYETVAESGGCLLAGLRSNAGQGHRPRSPARMEMVQAWKGVAGYVYRERLAVERFFGHQSSFGGGLAGLPAWVRTWARVTRWVGMKLTIYHARLLLRERAQQVA